MPGVFREFVWGVSLSSFQFEMGDPLNRHLDTNSDWWLWVRDPENIEKRLVSGDLPENGPAYAEYYDTDHRNAYTLGLRSIRIQVEWSRIFPCPTTDVRVSVKRDSLGLISDVRITREEIEALVNKANWIEVERYRKMISNAQSQGLRVIVNLHHFTLPRWLHDPLKARSTRLTKGPLGVLEEGFVIEFAKYAAFISWALGDLVDVWSIYNEPLAILEEGFINTSSGFPPGVRNPWAVARGYRNLVIAYARAYDQVKRWDRQTKGDWGPVRAHVGLIIDIMPTEPQDPLKDQSASNAYDWFRNRSFLEAVKKGKVDLELDGGTTTLSHVSGRLDWLGVNYYTRKVVKRPAKGTQGPPMLAFEPVPGYGPLCKPGGQSSSGNPCDDAGREVYPAGLYRALEETAGYVDDLVLTENGVADEDDDLRPRFIEAHVIVLEDVVETGVGVKGYFYWSLVDNYEWSKGFAPKFGLYSVDPVTKRRAPRPSTRVVKDLVNRGGVRGGLL